MKTRSPAMKTPTPHIINGVLAAAVFFGAASLSNAAFIIATDGSLGAGNFAFTGGVGGAPRASTSSAGNLPATTDTPPTFFTLNHVYGGTATPHEYTFTYTPSAQTDNVPFAAGTLYNSLGPDPDLLSSGMSGGTDGFYNIYRIHPANPSATGGLTTYRVFVNGLELAGLAQAIDQNADDLASGRNIGRWELIGTVAMFDANDTVSVTMAPETDSFVSMRASGIMFEYVAPIPEPSAAMLAGLGCLALLYRRRGRS